MPNFDDLTKAGTAVNSSLNSKLDYLAGELKKLQDANVPVILVIYHEVDKYAWFWWSKGTGPQFINLWKYTVDYMIKTKGIHNVLWTLGFGHDGALSAYNPGKSYIDLGGIDQYDKGESAVCELVHWDQERVRSDAAHSATRDGDDSAAERHVPGQSAVAIVERVGHLPKHRTPRATPGTRPRRSRPPMPIVTQ